MTGDECKAPFAYWSCDLYEIVTNVKIKERYLGGNISRSFIKQQQKKKNT